MTKTAKNFIIFFLIIVSILLFFLNKYNDIIQKNQIDILVSNNIKFIHSEISYQKKYALSLSILFSKNQNIISALKNNQPKKLQEELNSLLNSISTYTKQNNMEIQVHTKDLKVFVRSWENEDKGLDLSTFRKGLVKVQKTKQPFVSNELGKRFNIKAISPIFNKDEYIGSIEIIMNYGALKERLAMAGIDVIPIMDKKFLNIAKSLQKNKTLYDFVIIESNYNNNLYELLYNNKNVLLNKEFYYEIGDTIITFIPLGDVDGESVGYLVASFKNTNQNFNYLPSYEYKGTITNIKTFTNIEQNDKKIIIK